MTQKYIGELDDWREQPRAKFLVGRNIWTGSPRRRILLYPFLFFVLFVIYHFSRIPAIHKGPSPTHNTESNAQETTSTSLLHLLIPASSGKPNLCRTLLSAALLNYPTPILINWGATENPDNEYALHLAKINGILEYLRGLPPRNDNDLVLIVDGYDVWFQLRPDVLINRYMELNRERNVLLTQEHDSDILADYGIRQSVIFGADKKCWPQTPEHPACYAVPESTLSEFAFGRSTDRDPGFDAVRPRWLNSGTVLGPVGDVRVIFEAAARRVQERFNGMRDQWYFAELFGEQEFFRSTLLKKKKKTKGPLDSVSRRLNTRDENKKVEDQQTPRLIPNFTDPHQRIEFHIGLDYTAQLFHTNTHAAADISWLKFNFQTSLKQLLKAHNIPPAPGGRPLFPLLPPDISASPPPISKSLLMDLAHEDLLDDKPGDERYFASDEELPFNTTWGDVGLLVNVPAKSVPVLVHMNGDKSLLDPWWQRNWFVESGLGRHLLQSLSRAPKGPLAFTVDERFGGKGKGRGRKKTKMWNKGSYNSLRRENGGMWTSKGEWLPWDHVCGPFSSILFDGIEAGTPVDPNLAIQERERLEQERLNREREEKEKEDRERVERERVEKERKEKEDREREEERLLEGFIERIVEERLRLASVSSSASAASEPQQSPGSPSSESVPMALVAERPH